ncbi:hypothetical protein JL720_14215 [Aureococcus anophagefferens]|nr:hypothetical protein JL720_14215 [Aureococcus anophagefferens]
MAAPSDRNLPRKEADLFKSIVKFYETKQYKKGLKASDAVLRKSSSDGRGFLETRRKLLQLKPNNKMHWVAYALSNHLAGLGATAIQVIDAYGETIKNEQRREETAERSYEDRQLALPNSILEEEVATARRWRTSRRRRPSSSTSTRWRRSAPSCCS